MERQLTDKEEDTSLSLFSLSFKDGSKMKHLEKGMSLTSLIRGYFS
jgi:hypothetical protein